jgi:nanoRNase/pAp phosphatase (c-di-AMP/oligoRNAs hydrolase)
MNDLKYLLILLKNTNHVFIQMHDFPDPDAIASAFGLQTILKTQGIDSTICYKGQISKYNTLKMIETLNVTIESIEDINHMTKDDFIILVDSQKGNANITDFIGDEIAVIDHHPIFSENKYKYTDIRPNIGACSSIIAEYFVKSNIPIEKTVATALLYGIKMDTLDLSRGVSELDIDMFYLLFKLADIETLNKIQINTLEKSDLIAYRNAIKNIKIYEHIGSDSTEYINVGMANLGFDCPEALLGTISDFILSLKEVHISIVYSEKERGIKFSVRNETEVFDAGKIIHKALEGFGDGGGHKSMAGGFVPYSNVENIKNLNVFLKNTFIGVIENA